MVKPRISLTRHPGYLLQQETQNQASAQFVFYVLKFVSLIKSIVFIEFTYHISSQKVTFKVAQYSLHELGLS